MMQYGFGGYNTVGTTMFFEIDLAHRLQPRTEQLNALYTYRDYFRNAKNPAIREFCGGDGKISGRCGGRSNIILQLPTSRSRRKEGSREGSIVGRMNVNADLDELVIRHIRSSTVIVTPVIRRHLIATRTAQREDARDARLIGGPRLQWERNCR